MAKLKFFSSKNKNLLPLLAVAVLILSFVSVSYSEFLSSMVTNNRGVLSESDENKDEKKEEEKKDEKTEEKEKERVEIKKEISSGKVKIDEVEVEDEKETEDEDKNEIKDIDDNETETEFEQESEIASPDGTVNKFKFKLKTRIVNGKTIIETASGEIEVENSPEEAINSLIKNEILDTPTSFEAKTNDNNKVEFEVQGVEIKKLLGLFEVNLPKTVTIDSETGDVVNLNQSIWIKFLSLLSV